MIFLKTDDEIELLRQSNLLVGRTLAEIAKLIKPGVTTRELDKVAEEFIRDHGAIPTFKGFPNPNGQPFPCSLCTSVNEQVVHGIPNDIPLEDGDIVIPDELPDTAPNDTTPLIEVDDDPLAAPMKQFEELQQRAEDVEREENGDVEEARNGRKLCATRHGCQGATDCNYSYGSYPG